MIGYCVNKIVGWVLSPFGWLYIGLAASWVFNHRFHRFSRIIFCGVLVGFWVMGCGVTTRLIGPALEGEEKSANAADYPSADMVVILGGGMDAHLQCGRMELCGGADRVWFGAQLMRAGKAPLVSLSGGYVEQSSTPMLREMGVRDEQIVYFAEAKNTAEEAVLIGQRLRSEVDNGRNPKILLVTSAWHMRRASWLFRKAGLEVIEAPCDYEFHCAAEHELEPHDFFPSGEAMEKNCAAIKEWVAGALYKLLRR